MMKASFKRKKIQNPDFEEDSELNQTIWTGRKNNKIVKQIQELELEIDGWFKKFPSIFYNPNLLSLKEFIKTQIEGSSLVEVTENFKLCIKSINDFYITLKDENINITNNAIYDTIIEELSKEIFIEGFNSDEPARPYFQKIDLIERIDRGSKLETLFGESLRNNKTILIPYICSIMLKKDSQKRIVIEMYSNLHQDYKLKFMNVIIESNRLNEMKDLILSELFFKDLEKFLFKNPVALKIDLTEITIFLLKQKKFSLLFKLFELNIIKNTHITKIAMPREHYIELASFLLKDILENKCIIFSHLVYNKEMADKFIKEFFSHEITSKYLKNRLEEYLEKTISNSGDDSQKYIGFMFLNKLLEIDIIDQSLFSRIVSNCNSENLKLISKFLLTNDNRIFQDLLKELLGKQLINESDIFEIPDKIFLDLSTDLLQKKQLRFAPKINLKIFFQISMIWFLVLSSKAVIL